MIAMVDAIRIVSGDDYHAAVVCRNEVAMQAMRGERTEAEADVVRAAFLRRWSEHEREISRKATWKSEPRAGTNWTGD